jgi:hypothetical protein
MNSMMHISHRLYAAALADSPARKSIARTASPVIIEMVRRGMTSWPKERRAAQPLISREAWAGLRW